MARRRAAQRRREAPTRATPVPESAARAPDQGHRPGWDALVVAGLGLAFIQILSLAESAALPWRVQDVLRHPLLGGLLPPAGVAAMGEIGPRPGEPIGLLINALGIFWVILYLLSDGWAAGKAPSGEPRPAATRWKWVCLTALILTLVVAPTVKLILLRDQSGPASYTHDGGVIQTEATIAYFLSGRNPYIEDYVDTPMAEWGFSEYRTALYHYPYLPWTFLFSAPFYLLGQGLGFYDQRIVYWLVFGAALAAARALAPTPRARLALVAALALNPFLALDMVFGQNDGFVAAWLIFALAAWRRWDTRRAAGADGGQWAYWAAWICFGLACATKPTAWFFAPFFGLLMQRHRIPATLTLGGWFRVIAATIAAAWPALAVVALVVGPYVWWDWYAIYEDVWRWSSGQGPTGYQIWGWGAANFVLALGWVEDRFGQWPFQLVQFTLAAPLLLWLMARQLRANSLANASWHYGLLLLVFFYVGRFLNENYLGFILVFLTVGVLAQERNARR